MDWIGGLELDLGLMGSGRIILGEKREREREREWQ
jgi:hypothetical protein